MSTFQPFNPNTTNHDDNDLEPPADGKHKGVTLTDARALTSHSGNDGVLLKFKTTDGYEWKVWRGFKTDGQTAMTWTQVGKIGVDPMTIGSLEELNDALQPHIGAYYDVTVKTNGRYRDTTVDGLSLGSNPQVQQHAAAGVDRVSGMYKDEAPF